MHSPNFLFQFHLFSWKISSITETNWHKTTTIAHSRTDKLVIRMQISLSKIRESFLILRLAYFYSLLFNWWRLLDSMHLMNMIVKLFSTMKRLRTYFACIRGFYSMLSIYHIGNNECINHIEKHRLTMLIQGFIFQSSWSKSILRWPIADHWFSTVLTPFGLRRILSFPISWTTLQWLTQLIQTYSRISE